MQPLQLPIVFICLLALGQACQDSASTTTTKDWWETAQFYQIYPRSFMDSDGDGIGDLNGITSKLEYLKELGVTAAWLSPIFKSPMVDFGYDISDFFDIQPEYGTLEDFRNLIKKANELELKIILDFVPNHSSDENEWFKKSVKREKGYQDYYVWHDGKVNAETGVREPPSNWLQAFRGSAWEWVEERQQYYLHQFAVQQADLNYRNPDVVAQMKRVLRYWLNEGVAGFRCDAVPVLFEVEPDENGQYPDEGLSGLTDDVDNRNYLKNELIENLPETIDMSYQWRTVMDDYQRIHGGETRVLLIETYAPPAYTMQFYGNRSVEGAHLPFNFNLITVPASSGVSAGSIKTAVDNWLLNMPAGRTANWVIGNHDQRRAASRYGVANTDAMNMLVMILPGASVTYQGEELGMTDGWISWEDTQDPAACNANEDTYEEFTRDPSRTPFQWTSDTNAGFSTAAKTWLPLASDYETVNVAVESAASKSHLTIYKSLIELRKGSKTLQNGATKYAVLNEEAFVVKRYLSGYPTVVYVANLGNASLTVDLQEFDSTLASSLTLELSSLDSQKTEGASIEVSSIALSAGEALVLTSI
ncbi:maltase A1 [Drosophila sulfurigaster albostrigata]|uniref:maltase A1 n=1 Tax=Drosophila sulfurigaster albostrigata TaxID=89887 RepID=UPI002D21AD42|nr:maltase A1 [Drosophila sulfurigaster albostrigata]